MTMWFVQPLWTAGEGVNSTAIERAWERDVDERSKSVRIEWLLSVFDHGVIGGRCSFTAGLQYNENGGKREGGDHPLYFAP